jgi:radical SAM superfamily enzyme YgiQ (UPF0313 family)
MKILLLEPPKAQVTIGGEDVFIFESLALEYLAAGVGAEHDVRILDMRLEKNLADVLDEYEPDVVGITSYTVHVSLDEFPFPNRSLTAKYRKHYYSEWMKPLASIRTSKGCSFRCNFCALWKITRGRYLARDPKSIVEELGTIDEECVFFADDESLVDTARMNTLAGLIKASGIKKRYFLYARSDTVARNPKLLETWREAGLERVFVGLEFAADKDLNYIGKGSTSGDNVEAVRILQGLGIDVYASFILRPEFTRSDFKALRDYCRRLDLDFATFAVLTPLPGTELYNEVRDRLLTHNYDYFDFIHTLLPTALPLDEFYKEYYNLYFKGFSLKSKLSIFAKYPLLEILPTLATGFKVFGRLKKAHLDYEGITVPGGK